MLRACRRVLRPGGSMAYFNIFVTPDLPERAYRRALRRGPSAVSARQLPQAELLRRAGFLLEDELDVTAEFLETARAWYGGRQQRAAALKEADGEAEFGRRQSDSRLQIEAIEEGLLRRALFLARPATRSLSTSAAKSRGPSRTCVMPFRRTRPRIRCAAR